jgi:alcohol dehydrogenase class IV
MIAPFQLLLPPRILFGRGEAAKAAGLAGSLGARALVVHGRDASRSDWLLRELSARGIATAAIACPKEPDLPMLEAALAAARAFGPEVIVGFGGGAVLDLAKALAALVPAPEGVMAHLEVVGQGKPLTAAPLPFVAIPTTSGTGSEATKNAVIDVPSHRRKVSLRDDRMMARIAVVDPALTDGTPRAVTLASGLDALTQVIEPYVSRRANIATDALTHPAIAQGIAALVTLMEREDAGARDMIAWVSLTGGIALANAGLGAVHGFAGVIGGITGAAHGAICGTLLPFVLEANRAALPTTHPASARLAEIDAILARALHVESGGAEALHRWSRAAGLPGLAGLGLSDADHAEVAEAAEGASSMAANPVVLPHEALMRILAAAA